MVDHETTLQDHSNLARKLLITLEEFVDEIGKRGCTAHLESVIAEGHYLKGKNLGQRSERFIEDHLIFPVLQILDHTVLPRPVQYAPRWTHGRGIPDFALTTIPIDTAKERHVRLFGESKPPNKLQYAREDVQMYLKKDIDLHAVAVLTDGIDWELWLRPRNEKLAEESTPIAVASLQTALATVKARNMEEEPYNKHYAREQIDDDSFAQFTAAAILETLTVELGVDTDF